MFEEEPVSKEHYGKNPNKPPVELPLPPDITKIGTTPSLALSFQEADEIKLKLFKEESRQE